MQTQSQEKNRQICQCKPNLRKKDTNMPMKIQSQEKDANMQMRPNLNPLHCLSPSPYNIPSPIAPCIAPNRSLLYNCIHVSLLIARKIHFPYPQDTMQPLLFCICICLEYSKWIFQVILVNIHICKISFGQNTIQWIFQVIAWSHWFACSDCSVYNINWYQNTYAIDSWYSYDNPIYIHVYWIIIGVSVDICLYI